MDNLWAPWRMAYIGGAKAAGCIFCDRGEADEAGDRACRVLARGDLTYVLLNAFPYNNGHLMVVPYRHVGTFEELEAAEAAEVVALAQRSVTILSKAFRAEGFNIGINQGKAAGAGIDEHIHLHVVPRWVGDTNFMPVLGGTKVMPEYLDETYDRLRPLFQRG